MSDNIIYVCAFLTDTMFIVKFAFCFSQFSVRQGEYQKACSEITDVTEALSKAVSQKTICYNSSSP